MTDKFIKRTVIKKQKGAAKYYETAAGTQRCAQGAGGLSYD